MVIQIRHLASLGKDFDKLVFFIISKVLHFSLSLLNYVQLNKIVLEKVIKLANDC